MKAANDGLRFLLELASLVAFGYWGSQAVTGGWALAVALPVAVAAVWAKWIAAKSVTAAADPWRLALEVAVFGGAAAALEAAGQSTFGIVLAALAAAHLGLTFVFDQRHTARTERVAAADASTLSKES